MDVCILAAGYATRLKHYTVNMPKPLLPVNGKPIINYIVEQVKTLPNLGKLIVITNDRFYSQFMEWKNSIGDEEIIVLNDGTNSVENRLGAIGDIAFVIEKEKIDNDIAVIAGDNLFTYSLAEFYEYFKQVDRDCICTKKIENTELLKSFGVCTLDDKNMVTGFFEKPKIPPSDTAVYATYMFKKQSLEYINQYLNEKNMRDAPGYFIEWLHKKVEVYAYNINGECYDIGTVEAYEEIQSHFGAIPKK